MTNAVLQFKKPNTLGLTTLKAEAEHQQVFRQARIAVMAAMETGNFDRARIVLDEFTHVFPEAGEALRLDVVESYNIQL